MNADRRVTPIRLLFSFWLTQDCERRQIVEFEVVDVRDHAQPGLTSKSAPTPIKCKPGLVSSTAEFA